jgi:hypothetical protein
MLRAVVSAAYGCPRLQRRSLSWLQCVDWLQNFPEPFARRSAIIQLEDVVTCMSDNCGRDLQEFSPSEIIQGSISANDGIRALSV